MLLPFINYTFNGQIWRMDIDIVTDTIGLEIRNEADKKVSFSSVSVITGDLNFTEFETPERWLTGLECVHDGMMLLHHYKTEKSPEHKAVIAVDNEGRIIWSNYTYAFDHLSANGPVLYNAQIQPRKLFLADIKTGATLRAYQPTIDTELFNDVIWPSPILISQLENLPAIEPHGNIAHYVDHNNFRIVSLHAFTPSGLQQHLYVWDNGDLVYQDLLHTGIQKMQPESFMLYKNRLVFVKNKYKLKVINLSNIE